MTSPIEIRANDPLIHQLKFETYRYTSLREAEQFLPQSDEQQTKVVKTPWGGELKAQAGDYLVHEQGHPEDSWVVKKEIFEQTYQSVKSGAYLKKDTVDLVPLTQVTRDPDQDVKVYSLEGPLTVQAGEYYLARGSHGEIWPIPREKVESSMEPVEEFSPGDA